MNIQTIAEHQVDTSLLPENAHILDLGCLNFIYTNEMRRLGHKVYAVDIQELEGDYHRLAITNYDGFGYVHYNSDQQATRFSPDCFDHKPVVKKSELIRCQMLKSFMKEINCRFFDLIKMDVESSEREIILSLDFAPARQIEIEFHLHLGVYTEHAVNVMVHHLHHLGYKTVSHEKTAQHGCGLNYWSSLFILK